MYHTMCIIRNDTISLYDTIMMLYDTRMILYICMTVYILFVKCKNMTKTIFSVYSKNI